MTSENALTAALDAVRARYGPGQDAVVRIAVDAALQQPDGFITASTPEATEALIAIRRRADLARDILERFRKGDRGWRAYVNDTQMDEWQDRLKG